MIKFKKPMTTEREIEVRVCVQNPGLLARIIRAPEPDELPLIALACFDGMSESEQEEFALRAMQATGWQLRSDKTEATPDPGEVPAEVHESGWQWRPVDDGAFAPPFGTIRVCRHCGCLVAGGPNTCVRCVAANEPTTGSLYGPNLVGEATALQQRLAGIAKALDDAGAPEGETLAERVGLLGKGDYGAGAREAWAVAHTNLDAVGAPGAGPSDGPKRIRALAEQRDEAKARAEKAEAELARWRPVVDAVGAAKTSPDAKTEIGQLIAALNAYDAAVKAGES